MAEMIKEDEIMLAEAEALAENSDVYTHVFNKPFEYEGVVYEKLVFDFGKLTGKDSLAIEAELRLLSKPVVVREISGDYQIRIAARACTEKIGTDLLYALPLKDCNRILNRTRSFLMAAE